ncbi:MAG: hypothetical protein JWR11_5191 [Mycobacterium sp.]|jgi:hypothetical protein|nr:hypothetical protein [Mycobacterium sp.]MDT5067963.1 hypothetical protein [Mycobacterium sp.]MDT5178304.1 hypothetical protein [Mycobacterium sp.]
MTTYRILDERGDVVATKEFDDANAAATWFGGAADDGRRMEVHDGDRWRLFEDGPRNPE